MITTTLPRIDLHCHLDGSLSKDCLEKLLDRQVLEEELSVLDDCKNLAQYLEKFDLPLSCMQDEKGLFEAGYDFIRTMSRDNMDYVEVRFAPSLSLQKGLTNKQVIEAVINGLNKGKEDFGVSFGVIACAMRHMAYEDNLAMLKAAREFLGCGVVGADLAGNEAAFPMSQFMELFSFVRNEGMSFTIHAGECGSYQNIEDAIFVGASRIGHGIAMRNSEAVMRLCVDKSIGVEMCPVSNLQTKAVDSLSNYPMKYFLDNGVLVTINTDNRTVSNTSLDKEISLVKTVKITDEDIKKMAENAIKCSWASDDIKHSLWKKLQ